MSTLENVGAELLAPAADELLGELELGELDELELGELDEPEAAPEAPLERLGLELDPDAAGEDDEEDLSDDAPLEDDPAAIELAANNAAMTATLVFSMWLTP